MNYLMAKHTTVYQHHRESVLVNCANIHKDISIAKEIFGSNVRSVKGKVVHPNLKNVVATLAYIIDHNCDDIICRDSMFKYCRAFFGTMPGHARLNCRDDPHTKTILVVIPQAH
jgi:hypothetical protein